MALNNSSGSTGTNAQVVIGLFSNGNDAQQAIGELREEGFRTNQIGAAFRESAVDSIEYAARNGSEEQGTEAGRRLTENAYAGSDSQDGGSLGGPASGSNAVTPAGLSTGSGMSIAGAGRPGPIPGSDIPHHRSHEADSQATPSLDRENAQRTGRMMEIGPAGFDGVAPDVVTTPVGTAPSRYSEAKIHDDLRHSNGGESWWEKLKRVFIDDDERTATYPHDSVSANKSDRNFGTGEGNLGLTASQSLGSVDDVREAYDFAYSPVEFEASLSALGLEQRQARAFSRQLGAHGAIVTVAAGSKVEEAESILQRNNGRIRHEEDAAFGNRTLDEPLINSSALPQTSTRSEVAAGEEGSRGRIQLFGEVRRAYGQRTIRNEDDSDLRDDLRRPA